MGRPIKKSKIGNPTVKSGEQIYIMANVGNGAEKCYVKKQSGSRRYICVSVANGDELNCRLVGDPALVSEVGLCYIPLTKPSGGDSVLTGVVIVTAGSGYPVSEVVTLAGGTGTSATVTVSAVKLIDAQDESDFDGVGNNGSFVGGADYQISDTITLSDGTVITVDSIDGGAVDEFTVANAASTNITTNGSTLTQTGTSGVGAGFTLTVGADNTQVATLSLTTAGDYSTVPTNPISTTAGDGTGLTVTGTFGDEVLGYVSKLSNRNALVDSVRYNYSIGGVPAGTEYDIDGE